MRDPWIRQHFGPETTARPGFEDELADDLSAAWHGRPVGRVTARPTAPTSIRSGRSFGWKAVAGIAACAALVVAVVKFGGSSKDSTTPGGETDSSSQVTGPGGGSAVPGQTDPGGGQPGVTTVGGGTGGEVVPRTEYFSPACHDSTRGTPAAGLPSEASLETFGPLTAEPTLTIQLPTPTTGGFGDGVHVQRIPGGVLVAASALLDDGTYSETLLAAVDADGTTRWVRCFANAYRPIFDPANNAGTVTIEGDGKTGKIYRRIGLVDGSVSPLLSGYSPSPPPAEPPANSDGTTYAFADDGTGTSVLTATSKSGDVLWTAPELQAAGSLAQSFATRVLSDGVVLAIGCTKPGSNGNLSEAACGMRLVGVRASDGTILWQHATTGAVPVLEGNLAIVSDSIDEPSWSMIDTTTGELVPGQHWADPASFTVPAEQEYMTDLTFNDGGVVVVTHTGMITVWYPKAAGLAPHAVNLP